MSQNNQIIDEIFDPKPMEIVIGDPNAQVLTCGKNESHELSFKDYKYLTTPSGLKLSKKHNIVQISSGSHHTALVTEYGYVFVFGSTLHEKLGIPSQGVTNISKPTLLPLSEQMQVVQVACGDYHTLALLDNGEVWGWGGTLHKKIGNRNPKPSPLKGLDKVNVVQIGCGDFHSVALSDAGILFTWGGGGKTYNKGQTGHGNLDDIQTPKPLKVFQNIPIHTFDCGSYHTVALSSDGRVFSWGCGLYGELGNGQYANSLVPTLVQFEEEIDVQNISCGLHHTFFLTNQGKLLSCGKGVHGQTGHGISKNFSIPKNIISLKNKYVQQVSCGQNHTIILVNPNHVYATGMNKSGQLGIGDLEKRMIFTHVEALAGKNISKVFAGGHHSWYIIDQENPLVENYQPPTPLVLTPELSPQQSFDEKDKLLGKTDQSRAMKFTRQSQPINLNLQPDNQPKKLPNRKKTFLPKSGQRQNIQQPDQIQQENQIFDQEDSDIERLKQTEEIDLNEDDLQNGGNVFRETEEVIFSNEESDVPDPVKSIHDTPSKNPPPKSQLRKKIQSGPKVELQHRKQQSQDFQNKQHQQSFSKDKYSKQKTHTFLKKNQQQKLQHSFQEKHNPNDIFYPNQTVLGGRESKMDQMEYSPQNKFIDHTFNPLQPNKSRLQQPYETDETQKRFMMRKVKAKSNYNLIITPLQLNHKFLLINYNPLQESNIIRGIENSIQKIIIEDRQLKKYDYVKYNDFFIQNQNQMMQNMIDLVKPPIDINEGVYVVMLISTCENFMLSYPHEVPLSDYSILRNEESSIGPMYKMNWETIEQDSKWKILSLSYEIFIENLAEYCNNITIYELRSSLYK